VESRSDFEVKDRIQLAMARQFHFFGKDRARTLVSLYYEGRTGSPYSWVYSNDLNNDGIVANDLIAVPAGQGDARFNFSGMSASALESYFSFIRDSGLEAYAGGYAPRNAFDQPFINRLDLKLSQDIPIFKPAQLELFLDFTNFGAFLGTKLFNYYERTTLVESDTFWRRSIGTMVYDASGRLAPVTATALSPTALVYDNPQSRWRIQVGARLKF
jgi:hypothetical protein